MSAQICANPQCRAGIWKATCVLVLFLTMRAATAAAADQIYFPQTTNVTDILVQKINAETVRIDMSAWYLGEHALSIALVNRFRAGVKVRLLGDRGSIFETDPNTRNEFYWLASQGVPIRLRYNPNWFPEIDHWKTIIFAGQKLNGTPGSGTVEFGSANFTPFELAPASPTNYKDETILISDDIEIVNAIKTKFDQMWNDTTVEPNSGINTNPPFFKNWDDACRLEPVCADYDVRYPPQTRTAMVIDTRRLEPDYPLPPDLIWGQGPLFNDRLIAEISRETSGVDLVAYRLTVQAVADAMIERFRHNVQVRFIVEPEQYQNRLWPEYWLTHAFTDKLWAAGIPIKQRLHTGLTHMKLLVTSSYATNASSNIAANWQRDIDYFVPAATKPVIYQAMKDHFQAMWNDPSAFQTFTPLPADGATIVTPASGATGVSTTPTLVWNRAAYAVSYDVYMGPTQSSMSVVGNVPAQLVQDPPLTYSWTPPSPLSGGTTYYWKLVSRTFATDIDQSIKTNSEIRVFTTASGTPTPPGAPTTPNPANGVTAVPTTPTLSWTSTGATSYDVAFGTVNPPPQVSTNQAAASYTPSTLATSTTYFWRVVAKNSAGSTTGPVWSFTTASLPGAPGAPSPANAATGVGSTPTLTWTASGATSYDVAFGPVNPPPQVSTNQAAASYTPSTLATSTTYYWRVVAKNSVGSTTGSVWSFTTAPPAVAPPGAPGAPSPNAAATGVSSTPTLTWIASGATSYDVRFGTANPPPQVVTGQTSTSYIPGNLTYSTTYFWQIVARNSAGTTTGAVWTFATVPQPPTAGDIVINPTAVEPGALHGGWSPVSDPTAAGGIKLVTPDNGIANPDSPLASPVHYFEVAFNANAGTAYRIWLRTQALNNSKFNDAVWVQFSDAMAGGSPIYRINTSSGLLVNLATDSSATSLNKWGWQNGAYWLSQPTLLTFSTSGTHTLRVQIREDGVQLDQIVLSPATYLDAAPGPPTNDSTIVSTPAPAPPTAPATPGSPDPLDGAPGVSASPMLMWSASGATSYDVRFGTADPLPTVSAGQTAPSYNPGSLAASTTYFWQIVASNGVGTTAGPVWWFTTATPAPLPGAPASPSPSISATGVSTTPTLAWMASGATSYDVRFGTVNPPPQVTTGQTSATYAPAALGNTTTYFWQIIAKNSGGTTNGAMWSFTTAAPPPPPATDIVIYGNDVTTAAIHGGWAKASDPMAAGGITLMTPDNGLQNLDAPLASPVQYFDVSFTAGAGTPYRIWLRLQSSNNIKYNDAVWVQFSDALANGSPIYGINTTSGLMVNLATDSTAGSLNRWGWQNGAYWLSQPTTLTFTTSGTHTMRVQIREDGVQLDQIVLSPATYLNSAPGSVTNDTTIVPKVP